MSASTGFTWICISALLALGLVGCGKQSSTESAKSKVPVAKAQPLDQRALDLVAKIKAKAINMDVTGGNSSVGDGIEIAPNVEFKYFTDRFGEKPFCQVMFRGTDVNNGSKAIPKWDLALLTNTKSKLQFVASPSFFGPNNSIRIVFDTAAEPPLELDEPMGGELMRLTLKDNVIDRFMQAKTVTLNHGMAGASKVAYQFDTSSFPLALQLSNALCPM